MSGFSFFVTGAAGFVGRHLCQRLRRNGHRVIGLTRRPQSALEESGVEVIHGDISSTGPWQTALEGVDYVIHCAANASFRSRGEYQHVNVDGTRHLLEAVRQHGPSVRRFVFVSTIGAIDRGAADPCTLPIDETFPASPTSEYGRSKLEAERLVRESGLPYCTVRPAMVVGHDMRFDSHFAVFVRLALRRAWGTRLAWSGRFSVVHADDLAAALELCATHSGAQDKTFFCAGTPLSLAETFAHTAPGTARLPLGWAGRVAGRFPQLAPFKLKALLLPALTASDAPLRQLGWEPRHVGAAVLDEVITRERARLDPAVDPGGQSVITGAASGLGRALVAKLAPRRARLLLVDRDAPGLAAVQKEHPHCRTIAADLADADGAARLLAQPEWRAHRVLELFACAGIGLRGPVLAHGADKHSALFNVNLLSRLSLAHGALPGMIRSGFGRVVFISSSSAFQPLPYMASYAASNAALLSLGEAWAVELEGTGVHVLTVCPGDMQTNFQRSSGVKVIPSERLMPPADVADAIVRALARQQSTAIISARSLAMSLLARVLPRRTSTRLWKKLMTRLR